MKFNTFKKAALIIGSLCLLAIAALLYLYTNTFGNNPPPEETFNFDQWEHQHYAESAIESRNFCDSILAVENAEFQKTMNYKLIVYGTLPFWTTTNTLTEHPGDKWVAVRLAASWLQSVCAPIPTYLRRDTLGDYGYERQATICAQLLGAYESNMDTGLLKEICQDKWLNPKPTIQGYDPNKEPKGPGSSSYSRIPDHSRVAHSVFSSSAVMETIYAVVMPYLKGQMGRISDEKVSVFTDALNAAELYLLKFDLAAERRALATNSWDFAKPSQERPYRKVEAFFFRRINNGELSQQQLLQWVRRFREDTGL